MQEMSGREQLTVSLEQEALSVNTIHAFLCLLCCLESSMAYRPVYYYINKSYNKYFIENLYECMFWDSV